MHSWPNDDLEFLKKCPICDEKEINLKLNGLSDLAFQVAGGGWCLFECEKCKSYFLNPRPTESTISKAYEAYYTHEADKVELKNGFIRNVKKFIIEKYIDIRFRGNKNIINFICYYIFSSFKDKKISLEYEYRNIPSLIDGGRLLDVGCGNGAFIKKAKAIGWDVVGIDVDHKSIEVASKEGLNVFLTSIENANFEKESFDILTLSHVIEHIHNPKDFLKECFIYLKPGGFIWIDTPNIESFGFSIFGKNWRGLEVPRHLVLFNENSLRSMLQMTGFKSIENLSSKNLFIPMFAASYGLSKGEKSNFYYKLPKKLLKKANYAERNFDKNSQFREFLTMKAYK